MWNARIIISTERDFGCGKTLMERHVKEEFHVLVKELELFDREFFFKHIATWHFDFWQRFCSQRCLTVFVLFFNRFHSAASLADNSIKCFFPLWSWIFFQLQHGEKVSSTRKRKYCVLSRSAYAKLKVFLPAEKFLKWTPALICKIQFWSSFKYK